MCLPSGSNYRLELVGRLYLRGCHYGSSPLMRLDINILLHLPFTIYFPPPSTTDPFTRRLYLSALCQSICVSFPFAFSLAPSTYSLFSIANCRLTPSTARVILPPRPADPTSFFTRLSPPTTRPGLIKTRHPASLICLHTHASTQARPE
jgi:hypothetical protein